jgi:hypothetical protein
VTKPSALDDQVAPPDPNATTDVDLAELRATLEEAAGRLYLAVGRVSPAWRNLLSGLPGYRAISADQGRRFTPPEDFAKILADPNYLALADLEQRAARILREVSALHGALTDWAQDDPLPIGPLKSQLDVWCTSCMRIGKCSPIFRGELCRWCYTFNQTEHQRPPEKLLRLHHDNVRISQADIDAVLGKDRKKSKKVRR